MSTPDTNTDDSKLVTTDTVYVSPDGGTTDEAFPKPNVEYDFCVDIANVGELPSGSFFVRFNLSGDQDPPMDLDFSQDAGLDAGTGVKAVVHFGQFPNKFGTYHLEANCAGSFDITVNSESTSDAGSGGGDSTTAESQSQSNQHHDQCSIGRAFT